MSVLSHEELTLLNSDSKFRNYVSAVEKALKNFESSTEWADLISSLGKLKKVLQASKYQYIPKRISVCKRLAQCLHPALPSGVHLKALEVYNVIFENIKTENLSKDLFLYSSGLFPLLANAALSVKPVLLDIYETHFLPLKQGLRPCLIGLILGILPGLEEGSDMYTRTFNLLKNICSAQAELPHYVREISLPISLNSFDSSVLSSSSQIAEDKYFYTCLWSAIVSQSSVRFQAITFIIENYEKKQRQKKSQALNRQITQTSASQVSASDDQLYLIGNSIDLMVNGICCCLQDSNSLVQRSILDLINFCLPLNTTQITRSDKLQLIVVAIHVVLRRDMSLNRRIYTWLMGATTGKPPGQNSSQDKGSNEAEIKHAKTKSNENYFNLHSKMLLVSAIKMLLSNKKEQIILYLQSEDPWAAMASSQAHHSTQSTTSLTATNNPSSNNTNNTLKIIKIVSNLVERQEIGQSIIDEILLDLLFYIYKEYCSLVLNNNSSNSTSFSSTAHTGALNVSSQGHRRGHSSSSYTAIMSSTNGSKNELTTSSKEINELKKATSNFLFQSFQLFFIWDFCAKKFEKICLEQANSSTDSRTVTPGQLCDLYEFILDLLKTTEIYKEIQTDHLPLMLKRIIQTLNTHCAKMTNQDLTKSILLCSKILKKVVPKVITDPTTSQNNSNSQSTPTTASATAVTSPVSATRKIQKSAKSVNHLQRKRSQTEFSSMKNLKRISEPVKTNSSSSEHVTKGISTSLTNLCLNETSEEVMKRDVADCLSDMLMQLELNLDIENSNGAVRFELETSDEKNNLGDEKTSDEEEEVSDDEEENEKNEETDFKQSKTEMFAKNEMIFDDCVQLLKELFHTFTMSHLFDLNGDGLGQIQRAFHALFNHNACYYSNFSMLNSKFPSDSNASLKSSTNRINSGSNSNGKSTPSSTDSTVIELRAGCLNYLQSFHLLNKFLITILFFPRENVNIDTGSCSEFQQSDIISNPSLINSFDNWLKDLFLLSCSTTIPDVKNTLGVPNSKLFEFQSITINTLLELVHMSESVNSHYKETLTDSLRKLSIVTFNAPDTKTNKNVSFVQTVFSEKQIELIYNSSNIGNIIARMLWSHLNNDLFNYNNQIQHFNSTTVLNSFNATDKRAGILFCLLHETLPNNLCEDIIAQHLIMPVSNLTYNLTQQMDSFKRFSRLWHWSREINNLSTKHDDTFDNIDIFSFNLATTLTLNKSTKTFERSLLIILDILNDNRAPSAMHKLIQEWLLNLICEYNDLPRILDILLVSLLHPASARVSVQYFIHNLVNSSAQTQTLLSMMPFYSENDSANASLVDYESKVYAISNEGGHVKYHVNEQQRESRTKTESIPTNAVLNANTANGTTTKSLKNTIAELPLSILNAASLSNQSLSLRINPFTSKSSSNQSSANSTTLSEYTSEFQTLKGDEDLTSNDENSDFMDFNSKNSNFLERYKQIKKLQLEKDNSGKIVTTNDEKSPSHSIPSPKKTSNLSGLVEKVAEENAVLCSFENNNTVAANNLSNNYETEYYSQFGNNENEEDHEFDEDYEYDDEDDDDFINDYNHDENGYDFNQFALSHNQNTSNEDNRSQNTEITLLKDVNHVNGSSSSIDNTDADSLTKKAKRKSDIIISKNLIDNTDSASTQHQKSLSLSNQRNNKKARKLAATLPLFKRDNSVPISMHNNQIELDSANKIQSLRTPSQASTATSTNKTDHPSTKPNIETNQKIKIQTASLNKPITHSKDLCVDALNSIDPNYAYVLIYKNCTNMQPTKDLTPSSAIPTSAPSNSLHIKSTSNSSYDHVRTLFILRCIDQILDKCSNEFLTAISHNYLTKNNNAKSTMSGNNGSAGSSSGGFSVHNEKLLDLIVRHLKSIYGNSFYSSISSCAVNDIGFNLNGVTYIEAIILILLFYIRSYYPPSKFTLLTAEANGTADGQKERGSNVSLNTTNSTNTSHCSSSSASSNIDSDTGGNSTLISQGLNSKKSPDFSIEDEESLVDHDEKLFNENRNVQIFCLQILSKMIKELTNLSRNTSLSSQGFQTSASFVPPTTQINNQHAFLQPIIDLLDRCRLQKTLLHCFHSTIQTPQTKSLAQCILTATRFNYSASVSFSSLADNNISNNELVNCRKQIQYSYMSQLMECLENLIQLERVLNDFQTVSKIYRNNGLVTVNGLPTMQVSVKAASIITNGLLDSKNSGAGPINEDDFLLTLNKKLQTSIKNKLANSSSSSILNQNQGSSNQLPTTNITSRYIPNQSICSQSMFISCVLHYLKNISLIDYHLNILKLVRNSLPSAGNALKPLSTFVSEQLCRNLLQITNGNGSSSSSSNSGANYLVPTIAYMSAVSSSINIPDIIISLLKQLSYILHYCLLNTSYLSPSIRMMYCGDIGSSASIMGQFINSVPSTSSLNEAQVKQFKQFQVDNETHHTQARDSLLNLLPSILSHMTQVWHRCTILLNSNNSANILQFEQTSQQQSQPQHQYSWILGHPVLIRQCITEMLNPIAQYHSLAFMQAIGSVWGEKKKRTRLNQDHKVIIELVRSLKSFSITSILLNITDILRQSSMSKNKDKKKSPSNVWLLQFLHSYLENYFFQVQSKFDSTLINADFASNLCNFFKETVSSSTISNLAPACYFQLFRILNDSVTNIDTLVNDRKYTKDIQDSTHKLFELCNSIVASSLQQTTWLRKNFAVILNSDGLPVNTNSENPVSGQKSDHEAVSGLSDNATNCIDQLNSNGDLNESNNNLSHSLQALNILAEYLAKTLDIVYKSEEKDRLVVPLLANLMFNLWPYLKTHSVANKNNFRAASHLLMSLTVYPYTRKTWKKEVYEMLFENMYFHVDAATLDHCKVIVDNLISNDRSMFKDVLIRVTYQQSTGLFTSKEQESEQKAQLLKRLAFVIYSSEKDQYQKNMPEIQECIAHVLKLIQSPSLYSTLFLLFRILFLRFSSRHLIALWPTILSELIFILSHIEQDLSDDSDTKSNTKNSHLDYIGSSNSHLFSSTSIKLQIYLSACKLIDLILTLPNYATNQFQLYKWSFINTSDALNLKQKEQFVPYLLKISNLLKYKFPNTKTVIYKTCGGPLIRSKQIQSLSELKQFFDIVTSHTFVHNTTQSQAGQSGHQTYPAFQQNSQFTARQFEASVHDDFLEGWIQ